MVKKGGNKQIDLKNLRKEDARKHQHRKSAGGKPDRRPFKKGGKPQNKKKEGPASKEDLDREMENYWIKSGNTELGKSLVFSNSIVTKRLDNELDSYFAAAEKKEEAPAGEAKAAAK